jgi:hypothetical protein
MLFLLAQTRVLGLGFRVSAIPLFQTERCSLRQNARKGKIFLFALARLKMIVLVSWK